MCALQTQCEPKILPKFDAFIVEEEEGSGTKLLIT